jgi:hypothetical protein
LNGSQILAGTTTKPKKKTNPASFLMTKRIKPIITQRNKNKRDLGTV